MQIEALSRLGVATFALAAFLLQAGADRPQTVIADAAIVAGSAEAPSRRGGRPVRLSQAAAMPVEVVEAPTLTRRGTRLRPVAAETAPRPDAAPVQFVAELTTRGTRLRPAARTPLESAAAVALR